MDIYTVKYGNNTKINKLPCNLNMSFHFDSCRRQHNSPKNVCVKIFNTNKIANTVKSGNFGRSADFGHKLLFFYA